MDVNNHYPDIAVGWINNIDRIANDHARQISTNLTEFWFADLGIFESIPQLIAGDVDQLLTQAATLNVKWLLILSPGITLSNQGEFFVELFKMLSKLHTTAIVGHVLDGKEYYYHLHHQTILVNMDWFKQVGKPKFGMAGEGQWVCNEPMRSTKNFHDDYTPLWITKGTNTTSYSGKRFGWNIINTALESGYHVKSFPLDLRNAKYFLYPEDDGYEARYNMLAEILTTEIHFEENTEPPIDIPANDFGSFDACVFPAGGLNAVKIPELLGMKPGTDVVVIDISQTALDAAKQLVGDTNLNYSFVKVDILDKDSWWVFTQFTNKRVYINLSNIFFYLPTVLQYSFTDRLRINDELMNLLDSNYVVHYLHPTLTEKVYDNPKACINNSVNASLKMLYWINNV